MRWKIVSYPEEGLSHELIGKVTPRTPEVRVRFRADIEDGIVRLPSKYAKMAEFLNDTFLDFRVIIDDAISNIRVDLPQVVRGVIEQMTLNPNTTSQWIEDPEVFNLLREIVTEDVPYGEPHDNVAGSIPSIILKGIGSGFFTGEYRYDSGKATLFLNDTVLSEFLRKIGVSTQTINYGVASYVLLGYFIEFVFAFMHVLPGTSVRRPKRDLFLSFLNTYADSKFGEPGYAPIYIPNTQSIIPNVEQFILFSTYKEDGEVKVVNREYQADISLPKRYTLVEIRDLIEETLENLQYYLKYYRDTSDSYNDEEIFLEIATELLKFSYHVTKKICIGYGFIQGHSNDLGATVIKVIQEILQDTGDKIPPVDKHVFTFLLLSYMLYRTHLWYYGKNGNLKEGIDWFDQMFFEEDLDAKFSSVRVGFIANASTPTAITTTAGTHRIAINSDSLSEIGLHGITTLEYGTNTPLKLHAVSNISSITTQAIMRFNIKSCEVRGRSGSVIVSIQPIDGEDELKIRAYLNIWRNNDKELFGDGGRVEFFKRDSDEPVCSLFISIGKDFPKNPVDVAKYISHVGIAGIDLHLDTCRLESILEPLARWMLVGGFNTLIYSFTKESEIIDLMRKHPRAFALWSMIENRNYIIKSFPMVAREIVTNENIRKAVEAFIASGIVVPMSGSFWNFDVEIVNTNTTSDTRGRNWVPWDDDDNDDDGYDDCDDCDDDDDDY